MIQKLLIHKYLFLKKIISQMMIINKILMMNLVIKFKKSILNK
jgi:hypothetical protein